ncbi:MAG TPA: hypothetical protein VLF19_00585 [Methylomirabilota bacterium]|nr:hypothetical protein [Methylomirabilota bacterium]
MTEPTDLTELRGDSERLLIEAVVELARTLRDERDRLAGRLRQVESELTTLTERLEASRTAPPGA